MKKENYLTLFGLVIIVVLIFALCISINDTSKLKKQIEKITADKQLVIDSVNNANLSANNSYFQHEKDSLSIIALSYKKEAKNSLKIAYNLSKEVDKQQRLIDSLTFVQAECPERLQAEQNQNKTLKQEVEELNISVENLNNEAESYSRQLYLSVKQLKNDTIIIGNITNDLTLANEKCNLLQKQAVKDKKRVKSAIFFGNVKAIALTTLGIVGTVYIMK